MVLTCCPTECNTHTCAISVMHWVNTCLYRLVCIKMCEFNDSNYFIINSFFTGHNETIINYDGIFIFGEQDRFNDLFLFFLI